MDYFEKFKCLFLTLQKMIEKQSKDANVGVLDKWLTSLNSLNS